MIRVAAFLVVAGLMPATALAQDGPADRAPRERTLVLTGHANVEAPPDFALVSIGVGSKAATAAAAIDGTSGAAAKIAASAKEFGIAARDIQTDYVSLSQAYRTVRDPAGGSEQRPDGFQAANSVAVRVRDLGRLGEFLRAVVDGGANRIGGVSFGMNDPARLDRDALSAAVKDARQQAEAAAAAAGVRLGPVLEIRRGGPSALREARTRQMRMAAAAPAPVPVEAGSLDVSADVTVVYRLDEP